MRKLHFYSLPRALQDRFIESSRGAAVPAPLLVRAIDNRDHLGWVAAGIGLAVGWALFVRHGYGELDNALALASPSLLGVHAAFAVATMACLLRGRAIRWELLRIPYRQGEYLFPAAVIEARRDVLVEYDISSLNGVSTRGAVLLLEFAEGKTFSFDAGNQERAEKVKELIESAREQWRQLEAADTSLERARLHPLIDSGVPNPLAPTTPLVSPRFLRPATYWLVACVSGLMLAWAVWWWRNELSEKALYASATAQNSVDAYEAYLARGGMRADVVEVLLPRARLSAARAEGSVQAIRQYIADHPESKIGDEVQEALRLAVLGALEKAKAQGTVSALAEFESTYPDHVLVSEELVTARRAVYQRTLAAFEKELAPKNEQLVSFMRRLVAYVEKHGPRVNVRVEHVFPQKLETLDGIVSKSPKYYMGRKSLPTQYFLGEYAAKRETALAERLMARLQASFPKDIIEFHFLGPSQDINQALPPIEVPTLTLRHVEHLSGGFVGGKPKTVFLGASIALTATFEIPGQGEPWVFKWGTWSRPNIRKLEESDKLVPDVVPDVYEEIAGGAFEKFGDDLLKAWYG